MSKPKYPIYIPSKDRAATSYTAKFFLDDGVDFKIVIEPGQVKEYEKHFDKDLLLVMPKDDMKLLGSRLWIREHSIKQGHKRHWQFDDNIRSIRKVYKRKRIPCDSNKAIRLVEEFTDRYINIGLSGFNYDTFVRNAKTPYQLNCHVYSATLVNNEMPFKWRLYYNDDTDLCLQVLTNDLCTVLFNAFVVCKMKTMTVAGGNTKDLYKDAGRLKMARSLEEIWPDHVETKWRFNRPQHVIKNNWKQFTTPLIRRKDIDWGKIEKTDNEMKLVAVANVKSERLKKLLKD